MMFNTNLFKKLGRCQRKRLRRKLRKFALANKDAAISLMEGLKFQEDDGSTSAMAITGGMNFQEDAIASKKLAARNLSEDEIQNLIPPFNPNSCLSLNSEEWIDEVENVSALKNWSYELTMLYASLRLEDEAKLWFRANSCHWKQFKSRFVKEFPKSRHRSQFLGLLLKRRKEDGETFEEYANDVAQIAWKCNFNLQTAISYIISGLNDANMRNRLIAYNCKSIFEVLSRIQTILFNQEQETKWNKTTTPKNNQAEKCSNCHNFKNNIFSVQDQENRKLGLQETSKETPSQNQTTPSAIAPASTQIEHEQWTDLVTTIRVENVYFEAFVDLASKFTTMQKTEFQKYPWKLLPCDVNLRGFGLDFSKALGVTNKNVTAGQVEMLIEILVVEDEVQNYPVILGRNFLHNPNVSLIKNFDGVDIHFVESTTPSTTPNKKKKRKRSRNRNELLQNQLELKAIKQEDENKDKNNKVDQFTTEEKTLILFEKEIILRVRGEKKTVTVIKKEDEIELNKDENKNDKSTNSDHDQRLEEKILDVLRSIEKDYL